MSEQFSTGVETSFHRFILKRKRLLEKTLIFKLGLERLIPNLKRRSDNE